MNLQSGLSGGTPIQHMDHLSEAPPDDPNVFLFHSSSIRRPDSRGVARRQNINDFSTCGQRCIVSAADGVSCDANTALECVCQSISVESNALTCIILRSCSEKDINVFDDLVDTCSAAQKTHTHHGTISSSSGVTVIPLPSFTSTSVQSSTSHISTSFLTSTFSIPPSQTSGSSRNVSTPRSLPPSRTTQPPSSSSSIARPPLTTTSPFTSSSSSIQAVTSSSTTAVPSGISTSEPHPTHRNIIVAVATSLGLVVLAVLAAAISLYLRRLYRRRQLRQSARRAHPSDICVTAAETGDPKSPDALQCNLSNLPDTRVSTESHPSAPLSSVIDISGPRTSMFVAPPTPAIAQRDTFLPSSTTITPQPSGEDRGGRKTSTESVPPSGGPAGIDRGPPAAPPPADFVSVFPRRSGTPRGSRRFVTVLMELPDEEEHELPPPYRPGQSVMYHTVHLEELRTHGDV